MTSLDVRDMTREDEYFVGTCTHENESEELDRAGQWRARWLQEREPAGLRVKVAWQDGARAGFLYLMPIEICPWGPLGSELLVMPCLFVTEHAAKRGLGAMLIAAAEEETRAQNRKGLATVGYHHDFWFMPASYFESLGFTVADRKGDTSVLWKPLATGAEPPRLLSPDYRFEPAEGKVAVDLFWNGFCQTCVVEAERVREVCAEFGKRVRLREYCADDRETLLRHQIPRGIFVNGKEIGWGYEAPKDGIHDAIEGALAAL